jgi:hypothetical protein
MEGTNSHVRQQLTIRVGRGTLSFSRPDGQSEDSIAFEPFVMKSGVSVAANLREAFKRADLLQPPLPTRVRVLVDSDVLMVPVELFDEASIEEMYRHAYPYTAQDVVLYNVLPDLHAVVVFAVGRDLRTVVEDHFHDVRFIAAVSPVWRHLYQRSFTGKNQKLYGYFHEKQLEVFCFQQNRFKFCNSFDAAHSRDALYFLLYVWKQLQLQAQTDELHIVGDIPDEDWLMQELHRFLQKAYVVNPSADFNRHPATEVKGMPYDLQTLFVKGR